MEPTEIKDFTTEGLSTEMVYIGEYLDEHPWTSKAGRKMITMYFSFNGENWQIVDFKIKSKFRIDKSHSRFHFKPKAYDGFEVIRVE